MGGVGVGVDVGSGVSEPAGVCGGTRRTVSIHPYTPPKNRTGPPPPSPLCTRRPARPLPRACPRAGRKGPGPPTQRRRRRCPTPVMAVAMAPPPVRMAPARGGAGGAAAPASVVGAWWWWRCCSVCQRWDCCRCSRATYKEQSIDPPWLAAFLPVGLRAVVGMCESRAGACVD